MMSSNNLKNKIYEYFITRVGMEEYRRGWIKGDCPLCGSPKKYGVNLSLNRTNCFKCGFHERPLFAIRTIEKFDTLNEVYKLFGDFSGLEFKEFKVEKLERIHPEFPESYIPLNMGDSEIGNAARNYVKKRGFDYMEMAAKGWGYCTKGEYFGYLILPYFERGQMVYYSARTFLSSGPKFNNPPIENFGIGKSQLIYNRDALFVFDKIFLVESIMNAETIGENSCAIGGKTISNYQFNVVMKSPVKKIITLLDPDATKEALNTALRLCRHKRTKVVELPEGFDVNDLGRGKTLKLVYKQKYEDYNGFLKRKLNLQ